MKTIEVKIGEKFKVILSDCPVDAFKEKKLAINLKGINIPKSRKELMVPEFEIEEL